MRGARRAIGFAALTGAPTAANIRTMLDYLDGGAALLCLVAFVVSLVRRSGGAEISTWVLVSLPIIALLALGRIAHRHKKRPAA